MTLHEAGGILNEHEHSGDAGWHISGAQQAELARVSVVGSTTSHHLTAFEAIAVAEKYAAGATPESVLEQLAHEVGR